jgi:hypothetical protein
MNPLRLAASLDYGVIAGFAAGVVGHEAPSERGAQPIFSYSRLVINKLLEGFEGKLTTSKHLVLTT